MPLVMDRGCEGRLSPQNNTTQQVSKWLLMSLFKHQTPAQVTPRRQYYRAKPSVCYKWTKAFAYVVQWLARSAHNRGIRILGRAETIWACLLSRCSHCSPRREQVRNVSRGVVTLHPGRSGRLAILPSCMCVCVECESLLQKGQKWSTPHHERW